MSPSAPSEVVVITGASAGVGRATAQAFAERGARIGLLARGASGLEAARREVEAAGRQGARRCRPTWPTPTRSRPRRRAVEREFGPIDVWVNNAMASVFSPIKEMTAEEFRRVTEVTYLGYVHGTLAALRADAAARPRRRSCRSARRWPTASIPLQAAYCAREARRSTASPTRCAAS